jgi:peptidoglycan/LPS O-acetylase OafA/YrhL
MKRIGNFIYENRAINVIRRHLPMVAKPAIAALLFVTIWHKMQAHGMYLEKSELPLTMSISLFGVAYGVVAALVINSNWEKYKRMSSYVVRFQKDDFLVQRDEKMPVMLHILLGGMALSIQVFVMVTKYENLWAGDLFVFVSAFFLCLIGLIALELDDPIRSIWFQKSIPPEWMEINIKEYFTQMAGLQIVPTLS